VEFLHAIAIVIEESVLNKIHKSPSWSLLIDKNANVIMKNLENFFIIKMLNTDDLMYFSNDSASIMLARKDAAKNVLYFEDYEVTLKEI
ncbi:17394_t:CDS:2, partial [Funneliformis geosporum]